MSKRFCYGHLRCVRFVLEIVIYDRAKNENTIEKREEIVNPFYVFDAADKLIEEVLELFSERLLGFGTLVLNNTGEAGAYELCVNGKSLGWNRHEIARILVGVQQITIRQERMTGEYILLEEEVEIEENTAMELSFAVPYLTAEERALLKEKEYFIKQNWNVLQKKREMEETFRELGEFLSQVDYCERLVRTAIEYEMRHGIYREGGGNPGYQKRAQAYLQPSFYRYRLQDTMETGYDYRILVLRLNIRTAPSTIPSTATAD